MTKPTKILFLSDQHFPEHDPRCISLSLQAITVFKPHILVFGGDMLDAPQLAPFRRPVSCHARLQRDIDMTTRYLYNAAKRAGKDCKLVFIPGNHEHRREKYLDKQAPQLASLRCLRLRALLEEAWSKIDTSLRFPYRMVRVGGECRVGSLSFIHGTHYSKIPGKGVYNEIETTGRHTAQGHTHYLVGVSRRFGQRTFRGFENGCLCSLRPHYLDRPAAWHRGFSAFLLSGPRHRTITWVPVWLDQPQPLDTLRHLR
jgi:hypothetical protein